MNKRSTKRVRRAFNNRRGSIEIGINTIVIMVIAIVLLGLGIGFVKGIFSKMSGLTETISIDDMSNPPTASDPIKINPTNLEIKSGKSKPAQIGIYNKGSSEATFEIRSIKCTNGKDNPELTVVTIALTIPAGEAKAMKAKIFATDKDSNSLSPGDYVCSITASDGDESTYSTQFYLTVTA